MIANDEAPCARKGCPRFATPADFTADITYGGITLELHLCTPCGLELTQNLQPSPPARLPTFNHTREDSPLTPCPKCASEKEVPST